MGMRSSAYKEGRIDAVRTGRVHAGWSHAGDAAAMRDAEAQLLNRPVDTRDMTGRLMGDPIPERSSLSLSRSKTPDQPTDVRVRVGNPEGHEAAA